jgi:hypothetical protein
LIVLLLRLLTLLLLVWLLNFTCNTANGPCHGSGG